MNDYNEQICKNVLLCTFSNLYKQLTTEKQHKSYSPVGIDLYEPNQDIGIEVTEANLNDNYKTAYAYGLSQKSFEDEYYITEIFKFGGFRVDTKKI